MSTTVRKRGYLAALWELLGLMVRHWSQAVGGGIVGALLVVLANYLAIWATQNPTKPSHVYLVEVGAIVWACVAIPLSFFLAWHQLREENINLQEDGDKALPRLIGAIRLIARTTSTDGTKIFYVLMEIANDGFRSIVNDFHPIAHVDGAVLDGKVVGVYPEMSVNFAGESKIIRDCDAIYSVTQTPIERGDRKRGHIFVKFPAGEVPKEAVAIQFCDYLGRSFQTERITNMEDAVEMPHPFGMHPGSNYEG